MARLRKIAIRYGRGRTDRPQFRIPDSKMRIRILIFHET